jgi:hypothetical protein
MVHFDLFRHLSFNIDCHHIVSQLDDDDCHHQTTTSMTTRAVKEQGREGCGRGLETRARYVFFFTFTKHLLRTKAILAPDDKNRPTTTAGSRHASDVSRALVSHLSFFFLKLYWCFFTYRFCLRPPHGQLNTRRQWEGSRRVRCVSSPGNYLFSYSKT